VKKLFHNQAIFKCQKISIPGCGMRPLSSVTGSNKIINGTLAIPGDWSWNVITLKKRLKNKLEKLIKFN
jgi:hypothetical protein